MIVAFRRASLSTVNAEGEASVVLPSSTELFLFYRTSLEQCARLSDRRPLVDLSFVFKKWLRVYAEDVLTPPLSPPRLSTSSRTSQSDGRLNVDDIQRYCLILNTAEYCATTAGQVRDGLSTIADLHSSPTDWAHESQQTSRTTSASNRSGRPYSGAWSSPEAITDSPASSPRQCRPSCANATLRCSRPSRRSAKRHGARRRSSAPNLNTSRPSSPLSSKLSGSYAIVSSNHATSVRFVIVWPGARRLYPSDVAAT